MFAEGWAVYVEQVMLDLGYDADDPALLLTHWKFYLRAITNAILDVETHARDMTRGGGAGPDGPRRPSRRRTRRAPSGCGRASPRPSCRPTTWAALEMFDLETEARRRAAVAAGGRGPGVPCRSGSSGRASGDTPGFDYRAHLESVISHGTPPIRWVRRILAAPH